MIGTDRSALVEAVRTNCAIADARHAADMTLCTYLLQMRELHRWERGLPFGAPLDRQQVGEWIAEREAWWNALEERDFVGFPLGACAADAGDADPVEADPFDVATINAHLRPLGLLYGAGLVGADRPVFFLAELHDRTRREGVTIHTAGRELARGLLAPPATSRESSPSALGGGAGDIVIRRESMARWCWEKFEAFTLRPTPGNAFHSVVLAYGLDRDFDAGLARWLDEQGETLVLHELGEHRAGAWLGEDWARMRLALASRRADLHVRAVRDHLADLEMTLPTLLERDAAVSIHFWFSSFEGVREALFPSLPAAYAAWRQGDRGAALKRCIAVGREHFAHLARACLALHRSQGEQAGPAIERLLCAPGAVCAVAA